MLRVFRIRHIPLLIIFVPAICCFPCDHTWLCIVTSSTVAGCLYSVSAIVGELRSLKSFDGFDRSSS